MKKEPKFSQMIQWMKDHRLPILFFSCVIVLAIAFTLLLRCYSRWQADTATASKPVIYLYPRSETKVEVRLEYQGKLTTTWPPYEDGWRVTAAPDGTLTDREGRQYYCLFWEGEGGFAPDFSEGFCVPGEETGQFLRESLSAMGLTQREYNEFILYWLPRMEKNPYNLISFQGSNYTDAAALTITPQPDSVLRVMMGWKAAQEPESIPPQEIAPFARQGFTVVEWGGVEVKS